MKTHRMTGVGRRAEAPLGDRARRMRRLATGLLVLMAALFAVSRYYAHVSPAFGWLHAFSEAAMVGGLADWFAVTALFRHPLGLPIPHTAIIPVNKNRIADTMADFLRANFLTTQVLGRRLRPMNMAAMVGGFLATPRTDGPAKLRQGANSLLGDVLQSLSGGHLGGMVKRALGTQLEKLDVAPVLGQMLSGAIAANRHLPLLESIMRWAGLTLEDNEELLRGIIHDRANSLMRWTGLDEKVANAILDGLYKLLAECIVDPHHPLRAKAEEAMSKLAHDLIHDPEMGARVARIKADLLANPVMADWIDSLWNRGRAALLDAARDPETALDGRFGAGLAEFGAALQNDLRLQMLVNRFARRTLTGMATRYGAAIVTLVSDTVKHWDAQTVTDRIESAVGRDLQFIRINGTMVGGLVGVVLHAVQMVM